MKKLSAAMKTELAKTGGRSLAYCWLLQRTDGTVFAFTSHDTNLVFNLETFVTGQGYAAPPGIVGTGSRTYLASTGFVPSNVATAAALNIDSLEIQGLLDSSSILEEDLRAGTWDYARFAVFLVNWNDLSMGAIIERVGQLGDVKSGRKTFVAEMSGLLRTFQLSIGRLTSPLCDADVFDARCGISAGGSSGGNQFTVSSTLTRVGADTLTLFDSTRAEPGPSVPAVTITAISNANPGVITMANASLALVDYQVVTLSGIIGPVSLNAVTIARNPSGTTFELPIDTSNTTDYPAYLGSGKVSTVATSGWFDGGVIQMTSGPNFGRKMEVRTYVPGQWSLWLPFPVLCTVGDSYIMTAGCNKELLGDCKTKYSNAVNHRGMTWLTGNDRLVQVGRRT